MGRTGRRQDDDPAPTTARHHIGIEVAAAAVIALAAAVVTTWPLVLDLDSLAYSGADGPFQAWTIDHVQWAITGHAPLWDANIFAPNRNTLAYSDNLLGIAVPLLPLRWLGANPMAQLNVALLLGMATSAAGGYLFGRVVTGQPTTGVLTAAAFAFGPFGTASANHLHTTLDAGIAVAPAAAWWLADRSERGRSISVPVASIVATVSWQMSVSFYPGAYAVAATLVVLAVRWRSLRRLDRRGTLAVLVGLAGCTLAILLLALPYLSVLSEGRDFVRSAEEVADLGVDFLSVDPLLTVWGPVLGKPTLAQGAFPGLGLLVLVAIGLVACLRMSGRARVVATTATALVAVGAFLGLGTAADGWRAWSPYRLLFEFVPGFTVLRAAGRAWAVGLLGMGLLAGKGASALGWRLPASTPRRALVTASIAGAGALAVLVEGHVPWDNRPHIEVSAVDEVLAAEPTPGGVLYLPALLPGPQGLATTFAQVENVYGTTAHHRRTPNGYSGLAPEEWPALSRRMRGVPSPATLRELRGIGIRFVVVRRQVGGTPWERLLDPARAAPLELRGRHGGDLLYEVPSGPGAP